MNLLEILDTFLIKTTSETIDSRTRSKMSPTKYFQKISEKIDKTIQKPENWISDFQETLPEKLNLTEEEKTDLFKFVKPLEFQEFSYYMHSLAKILNYLNNSDELETEFAQYVLKNYEHLKNKIFPRVYPTEVLDFHKVKKKNKKLEMKSLKCPKCGSTKLVSYGLNYYCKSCKKQTRKYLMKNQ